MVRDEEDAAVPGAAMGFEDALFESDGRESDDAIVPEIRSMKSNFSWQHPSRRRGQTLVLVTTVILTVIALAGLKAFMDSQGPVSQEPEGSTAAPSNPSPAPVPPPAGSASRLRPAAGEIEVDVAWPGDALPEHHPRRRETSLGPVEPRQEEKLPPRACVYGETLSCPARALFENPDILEVAASNIMHVGEGGLLPSSAWDEVLAAVAEGFHNVSETLERKAPQAAERLDMLQLTEIQKDAVVMSLQLMSDQRVQGVGFEVGQAIRSSASMDHQYLKSRIESRLYPRLHEVWALREELMPKSLLRLWAKGHQWEMTFQPENIRMMQTSDGGMFAAPYNSLVDVYRVGTPSTPLNLEEKLYGIRGGVQEQARALVHLIQLCTRVLGEEELSIPAWATSLQGTFDFAGEVLSCELHGPGAFKVDYAKAFFCTLRFGAQGVDALRAISGMTRPEVPQRE
jgi:hypothetical protein